MPINFLVSQPAIFVVWMVAVVVGLAIHEYSHALAATVQGDNTAKAMGRLTLNPLSHIDLIGFLMLLFVGFGWGKPVPFNPFNLRNKKWGAAMVAIAGPLSNLVLIVISGVILKVIYANNYLPETNLLFQFLLFMMVVNVALMVFNLLPIPPLDGSKVLFAILPAKYDSFKIMLMRNGPWILLMLVIFDGFSQHSLLGRLFQGIIGFMAGFVF